MISLDLPFEWILDNNISGFDCTACLDKIQSLPDQDARPRSIASGDFDKAIVLRLTMSELDHSTISLVEFHFGAILIVRGSRRPGQAGTLGNDQC